MSFFKKLFGDNKSLRKTGVYKFENKKLIELDTLQGNGSINSIIESLGYDTNQVHVVMFFDSKAIEQIGFKIFTRDPVFVMTTSNISNLKQATVNQELRTIDWSFEYSSLSIEAMLEEGIEEQNLTIDFLNTVTKLKKKTNEIYLAPELGFNLHFKENILVCITSPDGFTADSKWLKDLNSYMFNNMLEEAMAYHKSELDAKEEVNKQCEALKLIPQANKNEHVNKHMSKFGNCNYYNLRAAHYLPELAMNEFLHINKGRYTKLNEREIRVDNFVYQFNEEGILNDVISSSNNRNNFSMN